MSGAACESTDGQAAGIAGCAAAAACAVTESAGGRRGGREAAVEAARRTADAVDIVAKIAAGAARTVERRRSDPGTRTVGDDSLAGIAKDAANAACTARNIADAARAAVQEMELLCAAEEEKRGGVQGASVQPPLDKRPENSSVGVGKRVPGASVQLPLDDPKAAALHVASTVDKAALVDAPPEPRCSIADLAACAAKTAAGAVSEAVAAADEAAEAGRTGGNGEAAAAAVAKAILADLPAGSRPVGTSAVPDCLKEDASGRAPAALDAGRAADAARHVCEAVQAACAVAARADSDAKAVLESGDIARR